MKKLIVALCAATAFVAVAEEKSERVGKSSEKAVEPELEQKSAPLFWGFGNYGIYSGYQLYGSLVNNEPTAQGYIEGNFNLIFSDIDLGYLGVGVWSNSDLTKRRNWNHLGNMFNEWDFNAHWGYTFWFDDDKTWGLTYRTSVVWYYYPNKNYKGSTEHNNHNFTTIDWDHYFELQNPYLIPYVNVVREYKKGANLVQFGIKKPFQITDALSLTPSVEFVWRERQYNWCFPTAFNSVVGDYNCNKNSGIATGKVQLDATYQITDHFGLFAKVAYCCICDPDLRDNVDNLSARGCSELYGAYAKDFAWGGIGVCVNF